MLKNQFIAKFSEAADSKSGFDRLQTQMQSKAKSYPAVNMKYISSDVSEYPLTSFAMMLLVSTFSDAVAHSTGFIAVRDMGLRLATIWTFLPTSSCSFG